ncbi:putative trehalose-phosphate phosphatase F [Camellia lanceoleosa]|uniref:Trehalose-phosphate phosphatase F n=1 Tax=Camellia lanceoleosa TaxID=1840588 RepID=A0ACC0GK29_9ERIC|nr:putative trehalose-phosphate phosphatase F [Camellia lanceoleosa]
MILFLVSKEVNLFQPASEFLPMIDKIYRSLVETTKSIEEAKVENNKFCVSVNYRNVDENETPKDSPRLRLTHGQKIDLATFSGELLCQVVEDEDYDLARVLIGNEKRLVHMHLHIVIGDAIVGIKHIVPIGIDLILFSLYLV